MARVVVTPAADADLEQIIAYLGDNAGYRIAARYVADFERLFDHVAAFPESGSPRPKLGASLRIGLVHPYVVIYRRYEAEDVVRVLRILHGARRITAGQSRGKIISTDFELDLAARRRDESCPFAGVPALTDAAASPRISFDDFLKVDIRVGTIVAAEPFPKARIPAYKLTIDFGPEIGVKKSSARITRHYTPETLVGRQVAAVVNFPPRQIGPFMSEVLTLGFPDAEGEVVLIGPSEPVPNGGRLY